MGYASAEDARTAARREAEQVEAAIGRPPEGYVTHDEWFGTRELLVREPLKRVEIPDDVPITIADVLADDDTTTLEVLIDLPGVEPADEWTDYRETYVDPDVCPVDTRPHLLKALESWCAAIRRSMAERSV